MSALARWRTPLSATRSVGIGLESGGRHLELAGLHANAFSAERRNREAGSLLDALLEREADAHLFAGEFIHEAPNSNGGDTNYVYTQVVLEF